MSSSPSEFIVEVVKLGPVNPLPNSDTLSITDVLGGYPCIVKSGTFKEGDLAVYVPIDSMVPTARAEFAFLAREGKEKSRVKAIKLRGTFSQGLLVPVPGLLEGVKVGQDVAELMGVTKYEPPAEKALSLGRGNPLPKQNKNKLIPIYGVEGFKRNKNILMEGEEVCASEKTHGSGFRAARVIRSETRHWIFEFLNRAYLYLKTLLGIQHRAHLIMRHGDVWTQMATKYNIKEILKNWPNWVLYAEVYGDGVQDLTYGCQAGERKLIVFDMYNLKLKEYMEWDELVNFCKTSGLDIVPTVYRGPWAPDVAKLAEGKSLIPGAEKQIREGICVRCIPERTAQNLGRVHLKIVSETYLLRKED
jgi:RNA ligase (TIGR02306 family)